jgi:hypothetical protein
MVLAVAKDVLFFYFEKTLRKKKPRWLTPIIIDLFNKINFKSNDIQDIRIQVINKTALDIIFKNQLRDI